MAMFENKISNTVYNLTIGAVLLYGFIVNYFMVMTMGNIVTSINPIVFIIIYFICAFAGAYIIHNFDSPGASFFGYNLIVVPIGAVLALCLPAYSTSNIMLAIGLVAGIASVMMIMAMTFPKFFDSLGLTLFMSLTIAIIAEIIALICGYAGNIFNWLFVIIFALYIGYDWHKAQSEAKTFDNAIDAAANLYLDLINLFIQLLGIISKDD